MSAWFLDSILTTCVILYSNIVTVVFLIATILHVLYYVCIGLDYN